ncbi:MULTISPECIES: BON domain-containing protein [Ramlibacter]|uniref:BON domain-containing protein n=1 Tax=Ramlibacter pinisoli TaxID=2682844 RepID=A0A6N8IRV8_9BURK|nr:MULTISPECIES: BON domain-containing protein [Ramlibacter]MBA2964609.1 BON domain-containing protein [Ramlibacter sp. CGMCC 1.13660]MVQ29574.1 BON domain-containing protein [Ramlibacter pinisoli]
MQHARHTALVAASLAALLSVAGCGERIDDPTVGQKHDSAVERSGQATRSARQDARESAATARPKAGDTATTARDRTGEAADSTRSAAADTGTSVMGASRDTREQAYGTGAAGAERKPDDSKITSMVLKGLKADKELNPLRIDVDSREGVVTLSGSVPSAAAKARASEIARGVKDVRSVNDQLTLVSG